MSAPPAIGDANGASAAAQAGFFGAAARPRFGWLHRAATPATGICLVIVPPFGYEAICAQRSLRRLAEQAARAGIQAVRFDLDGSGDSAGDDLDPDRLDQWLASIDDACALARTAGAERIVIAGIRLGAILASLAAARRDDVAGLVAIAAVPSGKALLREGHALQMALGLAPAPSGTELPDDVQERVGFALTEQTRRALGAIDLLKTPQPPAPAVLLIDRDDLAPNDALARHFTALGARVEQRRLPGYVEMMLDPHRAQIPQAILDATVAFAAACPPLAAAPAMAAAVPLASHVELSVDGTPIREEVIALDPALIAIATRPHTPPRRALILLNAGAVGRIGPNRLHVVLARRLAARGDLVLRLDLSGLGDSATRAGADENTVYHAHAVDDVGIAVAWARREGAQKIALAGLCAGAFHALKGALAGQPVDTIVPINPLLFHHRPEMPLDYAAFRITADAIRYQKSMVSGSSWRKLIRGDVDIGRVATVLMHRVHAAFQRPLREAMRRLRIPLADDLGTDLDALARRGVAIRFVFAADDPGQTLLLEQGGSVVPRLVREGALTIEAIEGPDHTFTPRWSHARLLDAIVRAIER